MWKLLTDPGICLWFSSYQHAEYVTQNVRLLKAHKVRLKILGCGHLKVKLTKTDPKVLIPAKIKVNWNTIITFVGKEIDEDSVPKANIYNTGVQESI